CWTVAEQSMYHLGITCLKQAPIDMLRRMYNRPTCVGTFRKRPVRKAIGYIRVSTSKQGRSGLGLEAQQEALQRFAEAEGFAFAETFIEVESGKHGDDHRPELARALPGKPKRRSSSPSSIA